MIKNLAVRTTQRTRGFLLLRYYVRAAYSEYESSYDPRGLLSHVADGYHFSTKLNLAACSDLISSNSLFKKAMEEDGIEVASLDTAQIHASLTGAHVVGRSKVLASLQDSYQRGGEFIVATGGSSVGKTAIMKNVAQENCVLQKVESHFSSDNNGTAGLGFALITDGRTTNKGVHTALINQFLTRAKQLQLPLESLLKLQHVKGEKAHIAIRKLVNTIAATAKEPLKMLIIDEADLFFTPPEIKEYLHNGSNAHNLEVQMKQIVETLQTLKAFCQQQGDMSVLLCTSDSTFPMALAKMGFKWTDITKWLVINEPSFEEISETLKGWEVGENLASALVDVYGTNLKQISRQLTDMALWHTQAGYWDSKVSFGFADTALVLNCVEEARAMGPQLEAPLMRTMKSLAVSGFVPTRSQRNLFQHPTNDFPIVLCNCLWLSSEEDLERQVVALLTRHKIASYVPRDAIIESLPYNRSDGIVPDTQAVRMLLIREFGKQWMEEEAKEK